MGSLRVALFGLVLAGCTGPSVGAQPQAGSAAAAAVRDANSEGVAVEAGGGDGACLDQAPAATSGGACWCDPSNPCQACCPATIDAAACWISASNYDTSCTVDSDCVGVVGTPPSPGYRVQFGNWCASECLCGAPAGINKNSAEQFFQDVARTPLGSGAVAPGFCGCPVVLGPCCQQGQCTYSGCSPTPVPGTGANASGDGG
jgi:hypothetical protein